MVDETIDSVPQEGAATPTETQASSTSTVAATPSITPQQNTQPSAAAPVAPEAISQTPQSKTSVSSFQDDIGKLRQAGFNDQQIKDYTTDTGAKLLKAGFSQDKVNDYLGIKQPDMDGVKKTVQQNLAPETNEEGEEQKPEKELSWNELMDKGLQLPIVKAMYGEPLDPKDVNISPEMRQHYIDSGVDDFGTFIQYAALAANDHIQTTKAGATGWGAIEGLPPMAAGFAAAEATSGAAAALAPETGGISLAAPLVAGIGGFLAASYATSKGQQALEERYAPEHAALIKREEEEHPDYYAAGSFLPQAAVLGPGSFEKAPVILGSAIGGGSEVIREKLSGEDLSAKNIGISTAGGALFNSPTALGRKINATVESALVKVGNAFRTDATSAKAFDSGGVFLFGQTRAAEGTAYLRDLYAKTGVTPSLVVKDIKANPSMAESILKGEIPDKYKPLLTEPSSEVNSEKEESTAAEHETTKTKTEAVEQDHYNSVKQAVEEGKTVPKEVLGEYPDLEKQVKEKDVAEQIPENKISESVATEKETPFTPTELPKSLSGAKSNYSYGKDKPFTLKFDSDIDKALYIVGGKGKSEAHARYKKFLTDNGFSDAEIASGSKNIRDHIKSIAKNSEPGELNIGNQENKPASKTNVKNEENLQDKEINPVIEKAHETAGKEVLNKFKENGYENGVIVNNKTGEVGESFHSYNANGLAIPLKSIDEKGNVSVHHNHPRDSALSPGDITALSKKGIGEIFAHTSDGNRTRASLTTKIKNFLKNKTFEESKNFIQNIVIRNQLAVREQMDKDLVNGLIDFKNAAVREADIMNRILQKAGLINYESTMSLDALDKVGGNLNNFINSEAEKIEQILKTKGVKNEENLQDNRQLDERQKRLGETSEEKSASEATGTSGAGAEESRQPYQMTKDEYVTSRKTEPVSSDHLVNPEFANEEHTPPTPPSWVTEERPLSKGQIVPKKDESYWKTALPNKIAKFFQHLLTPDKVSPEAGITAGILRETRGLAKRDTAVTTAELNQFWKKIVALSSEERLGLIRYIENRSKGVQLKDSTLQPIADSIREAYSLRKEKIQELPEFDGQRFMTDYYNHLWDDPVAAKRFMNEFAAKQGSGKNLKQRNIPTVDEGLEYGLKLKTDNPIETAMTYVRNMDKFIATHQAFNIMKDQGLIRYYTGNNAPEGWSKINGSLTEQQHVLENGNIITHTAYAPDAVATVYNNSISQGLTGAAGDIYKGVQNTFNFISAMKLGLINLYHFGTTGLGAMGSEMGLGFGNIAEGARKGSTGDLLGGLKNLIKGTGKIATSPFAPIKYLAEGKKVQKQYSKITDYGSHIEKLVDIGTRADAFTIKQPDYMKVGSAFHDFFNVFDPKSVGNELKESAKNIGGDLSKGEFTSAMGEVAGNISKVMNTMSKPLFDVWVPRLKDGAVKAGIKDWIENHPNSTEEDQIAAARQIGNSVDNRFGEANKDNFFIHQTLREGMQLGFLSYGWVVGGMRGVAKGTYDLARLRNSPDAQYLIGIAATYAMVNGLITYLKTGKAPERKDLFFPSTGGTAYNAKEREVIPGHTLNFAEYMNDPLKELTNEANPGLTLVKDLITNSDYKGQPITNGNNLFLHLIPDNKDGVKDYAKYMAEQLTPISIHNYLQGKAEGSKLSTAERMAGVRQVPEFITNPKEYNDKQKYFNDKAEQSKLKSDARYKARYPDEQ